LLLVKVGLVAVVVLAAALTRDIVRQRLYDDDDEDLDDELPDEEVREPLPVGPGAALADVDLETRADTARRLRMSVGVEVAFLVVVLCVTALLVNASPARTSVDAPFAATIAGDGAQFELLDVPARTGPNEMHITVLKPDGVIYPVLSVDAEISNAEKGIAPIKLTLVKLGPGHYTTNNLTIPFSGAWKVDIRALVTEVDEIAVTTNMNIRS
jgi:copper transport protein